LAGLVPLFITNDESTVKALKMGIGIAIGTFIVFAIDQGGITSNAIWRSVATGILAGLLLAGFYAYQARRSGSEA
jgi:high-affinity Fe2+/Pb2+ permease